MIKQIVFILLAIFILGGCSQKISGVLNESTKNSISQKESFEDEFESEFEDTKEVSDPLIGYNRFMTSINDKLYIYAYNPISKGYASVVPEIGRVGISNFFNNLKFPINFTNNILQLKFDHGIKELARFMLNSTVGLLGFIDVATYAGIESYEEDFGQTLGHYGVGSGFHIVLPFFGPSNLRDALSLSVDMSASPISYTSQPYQIPRSFEEAVAMQTGYYMNKNSLHLGEYESLKKDALDYYLFFRDAYEQKRDREIEE
jgi:phospholipid-binding lipoprotein MlaA